MSRVLFPTLLLAAALCGTLASGACGSETQDEDAGLAPVSRKVVFMAGFKPQANLPFVAAYVAQEKGYFSEQGLEVEIRHASTGQHLQLLMAGEVDFTTAAATSVLKRRADPELPVVAFALFGQRGQQAFVALKDSGIETLADWEGKTFGFKISPPAEYLAMLISNNIDRSKIKEVNAGFDPRVLTEGKVDILAVFKSNEPDTVRGLGFALNVWDPEDYGVPSMGLTYITRQSVIEQDPELVERFLKATLKGVQFAMDRRDETVDIVMKFAPNEKRDHQRFMLDTELEDSVGPVTDKHGLGWMTEEQWQALYQRLQDFEALPAPFDFRTAYTDRFLRAVYDGTHLRWP